MRNQGIVLALGVLLVAGCTKLDPKAAPIDISNRPIRVVATTNIVADLVRVVGGDRVDVHALMGPGVDPHLFKASAGDVARMAGADVVIYNGLHLEGKMTEVFEQMHARGIPTLAVAEHAVPDTLRRESALFQGNYDPHVWFDVALWRRACETVQEFFAELDPAHAGIYDSNSVAYTETLEVLDAYVAEQALSVAAAQRVLVTSHDAFGYFGRAYRFEVRGLQGISTATEAGTADVQEVAEMVATRRIPAMFVESSVSPRGIEAVREAVRARDFDVVIGGTLYGDALAAPDMPAGTYLGMVRQNIDTIVRALKPAVEHSDAVSD